MIPNRFGVIQVHPHKHNSHLGKEIVYIKDDYIVLGGTANYEIDGRNYI